MEWCGMKEGGGAELTHLSSSSLVSSSSPMSVHGCWLSFIMKGAHRRGWWWSCVSGVVVVGTRHHS